MRGPNYWCLDKRGSTVEFYQCISDEIEANHARRISEG